MKSSIKVYLLLLVYHFYCNMGCEANNEIEESDKPYKILKVKVPLNIWRQALYPTPVLKSQMTVVVPVYVAGTETNNEESVTEIAVIQNEVNTSTDGQVQQDPIAAPEVPVTAANDTQSTLDEEATEPSQDVTGSVIRFPCSCVDGQCGCCTGALMDRIRMKACGNISFIPEDFLFDVRLSVNNNTVMRQRVSASDPPPICFNPRRAPLIQVCAELSNIRVRNSNAYACLDINANIGGFPVYSASFRCFGLGSKGVQTGLKPKPVSSGPQPVQIFGSNSNDEGSFLSNVVLGGAEYGGIDFGEVADTIGDTISRR